eukprot:gnl/Dysnectes_brevis/7284_a12081_192.p1 GENE.gnl/Dysnectes_brevis/7284_a12081_192~~gnl/Dysnectes_brevis/7284_a12081_192.p1  ORF type:complete len:1180 (-),score=245.51 gnl/Dysnectes_brevis/7284_a12081_192:31-3570(-)
MLLKESGHGDWLRAAESLRSGALTTFEEHKFSEEVSTPRTIDLFRSTANAWLELSQGLLELGLSDGMFDFISSIPTPTIQSKIHSLVLRALLRDSSVARGALHLVSEAFTLLSWDTHLVESPGGQEEPEALLLTKPYRLPAGLIGLLGRALVISGVGGEGMAMVSTNAMLNSLIGCIESRIQNSSRSSSSSSDCSPWTHRDLVSAHGDLLFSSLVLSLTRVFGHVGYQPPPKDERVDPDTPLVTGLPPPRNGPSLSNASYQPLDPRRAGPPAGVPATLPAAAALTRGLLDLLTLWGTGREAVLLAGVQYHEAQYPSGDLTEVADRLEVLLTHINANRQYAMLSAHTAVSVSTALSMLPPMVNSVAKWCLEQSPIPISSLHRRLQMVCCITTSALNDLSQTFEENEQQDEQQDDEDKKKMIHKSSSSSLFIRCRLLRSFASIRLLELFQQSPLTICWLDGQMDTTEEQVTRCGEDDLRVAKWMIKSSMELVSAFGDDDYALKYVFDTSTLLPYEMLINNTMCDLTALLAHWGVDEQWIGSQSGVNPPSLNLPDQGNGVVSQPASLAFTMYLYAALQTPLSFNIAEVAATHVLSSIAALTVKQDINSDPEDAKQVVSTIDGIVSCIVSSYSTLRAPTELFSSLERIGTWFNSLEGPLPEFEIVEATPQKKPKGSKSSSKDSKCGSSKPKKKESADKTSASGRTSVISSLSLASGDGQTCDNNIIFKALVQSAIAKILSPPPPPSDIEEDGSESVSIDLKARLKTSTTAARIAASLAWCGADTALLARILHQSLTVRTSSSTLSPASLADTASIRALSKLLLTRECKALIHAAARVSSDCEDEDQVPFNFTLGVDQLWSMGAAIGNAALTRVSHSCREAAELDALLDADKSMRVEGDALACQTPVIAMPLTPLTLTATADTIKQYREETVDVWAPTSIVKWLGHNTFGSQSTAKVSSWYLQLEHHGLMIENGSNEVRTVNLSWPQISLVAVSIADLKMSVRTVLCRQHTLVSSNIQQALETAAVTQSALARVRARAEEPNEDVRGAAILYSVICQNIAAYFHPLPEAASPTAATAAGVSGAGGIPKKVVRSSKAGSSPKDKAKKSSSSSPKVKGSGSSPKPKGSAGSPKSRGSSPKDESQLSPHLFHSSTFITTSFPPSTLPGAVHVLPVTAGSSAPAGTRW